MMLTRRTILTSGLSLPFLRALPVLACDDPPNHYEEPCDAAVPRQSGYYPIAESQNYFAVNEVIIDILPVEFEALETFSQTSHITQTFGPVALRGNLVSLDLQIFATPLTNVTYELWGQASRFQTRDDYKGKKIAIGAPEFGYGMAVANLAGSQDLSSQEFATVTLPASGERVNAIEAGAVDAVWLTGSYDERMKATGLDKIYQTEFVFAPFVFVAPRNELEQERNLSFYSGFLKAISQAIGFLQENPDESVKIIRDTANVNEETARLIYADYAQSEVMPTLNIEALDNVRLSLIDAYPDRADQFRQIDLNEVINQKIVEFSRS